MWLCKIRELFIILWVITRNMLKWTIMHLFVSKNYKEMSTWKWDTIFLLAKNRHIFCFWVYLIGWRLELYIDLCLDLTSFNIHLYSNTSLCYSDFYRDLYMLFSTYCTFSFFHNCKMVTHVGGNPLWHCDSHLCLWRPSMVCTTPMCHHGSLFLSCMQAPKNTCTFSISIACMNRSVFFSSKAHAWVSITEVCF